jgi:hypothetical protein
VFPLAFPAGALSPFGSNLQHRLIMYRIQPSDAAVLCARQLFVADPHEHIMTQDRFLFSWRLLVIDAVLVTYMLLLTFVALLLGLNATADIVAFALFRSEEKRIATRKSPHRDTQSVSCIYDCLSCA